MTRDQDGRAFVPLVAITALAVAIVALVVALTRNPSQPSASVERSTTSTGVTTSTPQISRAGTLSVDGTGRPTLELIGYVRIPITHTGRYTWTGRLLTAPSSVLSVGGHPDAGGTGYRVVGTAQVRSFRDTWVGDFPKGHRIGARVTFDVVSYRGRPYVELLGGTISGAPPTPAA